MAERNVSKNILPPPGQYSRHEIARHEDPVGKSIDITLEKPVVQGKSELIIFFSRFSRYLDSAASMKYPNGLEVSYNISNRKFNIHAWNPNTQFGHIYYGRTGTPVEVALEPFVETSTQFWKDAPTPEDLAVMHQEKAAFERELEKLHEQYGSNVPLSEIKPWDTSPVNVSYIMRLRDIQRAEWGNKQKLVRRGTEWIVLQDENTDHTLEDITQEIVRIKNGEVSEADSWLTQPTKFTELARAAWGQTFLFNEWRVTIDRQNDQLIVRQESASGQKRKIMVAPVKVDHEVLKTFGKDPENWDKVFDAYPSKFYIEA